MGHDGREDTYAKLIQKFIHNLVGVSIKYKVQNLDLELIKGVEGDDKGKWKHHQHLDFSSSAVQKKEEEKVKSKFCSFYVTLVQHRVPCSQVGGETSDPLQREQERSPA